MIATDLTDNLGSTENAKSKTVAIEKTNNQLVLPNASISTRWSEKGKWNLEKKALSGENTKLRLSLKGHPQQEVVAVGFPYFGNVPHEHFVHTSHGDIVPRDIPAIRLTDSKGEEMLVATVYDLFLANYGVDQGISKLNVALDYDDDVPYTPAWQEKVTGIPRAQVIQLAREFSETAALTEGRAMVDAVGSPRLSRAYSLLWSEASLGLVAARNHPASGRGGQVDSHQALLDAILAGPPEQAGRVAREHLTIGLGTALAAVGELD